MPAKRSYVPKVKGCKRCSVRRINCDRTTPICNKCRERNLECSIVADIARENHSAELPPTASTFMPQMATPASTFIPQMATPGLSTPMESPGTNLGSFLGFSDPQLMHDASGNNQELMPQEAPQINRPPEGWHPGGIDADGIARQLKDGITPLMEEITKAAMSNSLQEKPNLSPATLAPLLGYYSLYMVPALRAMDAPNPEAEGWTSVVLPAAYTNPTVFMGIAAAAAMHISVKNDPRRARFQPGAAFLYRSAVAAFSSDGHSTVKNTPHDKRMLMVASTMLLVCTRISQSRDFAPIMAAVYDAVNRAKDTLLSDDQDELCKFVSYQAMSALAKSTALYTRDPDFHMGELEADMPFCFT